MVRTIQWTTPRHGQGAFFQFAATAPAGTRYPSDGTGNEVDSNASSLWTNMGLTAGTFEVFVESIHPTVPGPTTPVTLTGLAAGTHVVVATSRMENVNIPFADGFEVDATVSGYTITFRIQKYITSDKV